MRVLEVNGYEVEVAELEDAMISSNGLKLFEVTLDGGEFDNIRAVDIDHAVELATIAVRNN